MAIAGQEDTEDGLVTVATVYSLPEASVLMSVLRAYRFAAFAKNQAMIGTMPSFMVALGGIHIAVPQEQADDAEALLATADGGWSPPPPAYSDNRLLNVFMALAIIMLCGVPPSPRARGVYSWSRLRSA